MNSCQVIWKNKCKRKTMSHKDVRKGVTNANFNEEMSGFLMGEIFLLSVMIGLYFQSWIAFGLVFLGLIVALFIKTLAMILIVGFSIAWGVLGWALGSLFDSTGASITIAVIAFIASFGGNLAALEWARDIGGADDK